MSFRKQLIQVDQVTDMLVGISPDNVFYGKEEDKLKYYRAPYVRIWCENGGGYNGPSYTFFSPPKNMTNDREVVRVRDYDVDGFECWLDKNASITPALYVQYDIYPEDIEEFFTENPGENYYVVSIADYWKYYFYYRKNNLVYKGFVYYYVTRENPNTVVMEPCILNRYESYYGDSWNKVKMAVNRCLNTLNSYEANMCNSEGFYLNSSGDVEKVDYTERSGYQNLTTVEGEKFDYNNNARFYGNITKIYFSDGVDTLTSQQSLSSLPNLQEIRLGRHMTSLGNNAFYLCKLSGVTIPDSVTSIGSGCFEYGGMQEITLSKNLTSIPNQAFYSMTQLTSIEIPGSVKSIGQEGFRQNNMSGITFNEGLESIGYRAFYSCSFLTSLYLPDTLTNIADETFERCYSLTELKLPSNLTVLNSYMFYDCRTLTSVVIPDSVQTIGMQTFYGCNALSSVQLPSNLTLMSGGPFTLCGALTEIEIPASLKVLPGTFYSCTSLQNVILHEGLEQIGDYAFQNCSSLTEIVIPTSVTKIDSYAFDKCSNLTVIYYSGTATGSPWGASNATVLPNPN